MKNSQEQTTLQKFVEENLEFTCQLLQFYEGNKELFQTSFSGGLKIFQQVIKKDTPSTPVAGVSYQKMR